MNQFKRAQAVMLPTKQILQRNSRFIESNVAILCNKDSIAITTIDMTATINHLYIISDDEIKIGNWFYNYFTKTIQRLKSNPEKVNNLKNCKKIISTSDKSLTIESRCFYDANDVGILKLPQPSQQFITKYIEEYNKGNIITDVLVEYDYYEMDSKVNYRGNYDFKCNNCNFSQDDLIFSSKPTYCFNCNKLKINPKDNTITIKKLKDSWNRAEIKEKLFEALTADGPGAFNMGWESKDARDWIAQNL